MNTIALSMPIKSKAAAIKITGSLGKPSKMPGLSYGISATLCKIGAALAKVKGSTCFNCYALKANYAYPSVKAAHEKRRGFGYQQGRRQLSILIFVPSAHFRLTLLSVSLLQWWILQRLQAMITPAQCTILQLQRVLPVLHQNKATSAWSVVLAGIVILKMFLICNTNPKGI